MLINLVKKSFNQVINNSSVILFLVTFLIMASLIAPLAKTRFLAVSLGICMVLLTIVYFSGWFHLINTIAKTNEEEMREKKSISVFFEGVGKNFIPVLVAFIFYIIVFFGALYLTGMIANHFFGNINEILKDIIISSDKNSNLIELIAALPTEKQYALYGWQLCLIVASCLLGFGFMMYCPALINAAQNVFLRPFIAIYDNMKFLFKNFFPCFGIYALIYGIYVILSLLRALSEKNMILSVLLLFIYLYFLTIVVVLIFNYYEAKNNSSDRSECIRENEDGNTTGKSD